MGKMKRGHQWNLQSAFAPLDPAGFVNFHGAGRDGTRLAFCGMGRGSLFFSYLCIILLNFVVIDVYAILLQKNPQHIFLASPDALEVIVVTHSLTESLSVSTDFTDVTLVSDDTY